MKNNDKNNDKNFIQRINISKEDYYKNKSYLNKIPKNINEVPKNPEKVSQEMERVKNKSTVSLGDINKVKQNLQNPNHVWEF